MITADLLLDCIILLIHDSGARNRAVVAELMQIFEDDAKTALVTDNNEVAQFWLRVLRSLSSGGIDFSSKDECRLLMMRFKTDPIMSSHRDLALLLEDALLNREQFPGEKLTQIADRIQKAMLWHRSNKSVRSMFAKLNRASELVNPVDQARELQAMLRLAEDLQASFRTAGSLDSGSAAVDKISFHDKDSLKRGMEKFTQRNIAGVMRTGLQGINRMFGKARGMVRGESIVYNALPHNFKTGMLTSTAVWIVIHNEPVKTVGKKPMVLMISLENEAYQNMFWVFRQQYFMQTGEDPSGMTNDQIIEWTFEFFSKHGFELVIERHLPQNFGYEELVGLIEGYEAQGYEIYACILDYMNIMRKGTTDKNSSGAGMHLQVRDLFSRCCNYTKTKGITLITAHPLNRKAQEVASIHRNVVAKLNAEHLADSLDVQREVDVSIFLHLEKNDESIRFLTLRMDKHRYVDDTPETDKTTAYAFTKFGIMDDLNGAPRYVKDIYAFTWDDHLQNTAEAAETIAAASAVF